MHAAYTGRVAGIVGEDTADTSRQVDVSALGDNGGIAGVQQRDVTPGSHRYGVSTRRNKDVALVIEDDVAACRHRDPTGALDVAEGARARVADEHVLVRMDHRQTPGVDRSAVAKSVVAARQDVGRGPGGGDGDVARSIHDLAAAKVDVNRAGVGQADDVGGRACVLHTLERVTGVADVQVAARIADEDAAGDGVLRTRLVAVVSIGEAWCQCRW